MGYTLWRNGELLGEVLLAYPSSDPQQLGGMFAPTEAFRAVGPVTQSRLAMLPWAPVIQGGATEVRKATRPTPVSPIRERTQAKLRGIPVEQELVIRAPDGRHVLTDSITVQELALPWVEGELQSACDAIGVTYTG